MDPTSPLRSRLRALPAVRRVVASWRRLSGGATVSDDARSTLVACSGGADSSALAIALATTCASIHLGHIVHDMRPVPEAEADAARVTELASLLGVPCLTARIRARPDGGNLEAASRRHRYAALRHLAEENHIPLVATAHHQGDQAETVLMRLMRGVGSRGIGAIRPMRPLGATVTLLRPMLTISRAEAEAICRAAHWCWADDPTNADPARLRAALRANVLPLLDELRPGASAAIARSAQILGEQATAIERAAHAIKAAATRSDDASQWPRELLREQPAVVLGALLRAEAPGLSWAECSAIIRALHDRKRHERVFSLGSVQLRIDASAVRLSSTPHHASCLP